MEEHSVGKRRFHPKGIFSPRSPLGPTQPSWRGNARRFRAWKGKEVGVSPVSQTQSSDIGSGLDFPALGQNREFSGLWMCLPKGMNVPCDISKREFLELFTHHQEFSGKEKQKKSHPSPFWESRQGHRTAPEGFENGFVPGWDTPRGLSRPQFDPEKSRASRGRDHP